MTNVLLAVDGPSLVHRSYAAMEGTRLATSAGRPTWALHGMCSQLAGAMEWIGADGLVVGFDDRSRNARKERWPSYKKSRPPRPAELQQQLADAVDLLT